MLDKLNQILHLGHKAKDRGVVIVPDWLDEDLFFHVWDFIRVNPDYAFLDNVDYAVPKHNKGLESKNPHNAGPTIDELADLYGGKAIKKAQEFAEENNASLVLLHTSRGFGQLGVSASLYGKVE
ncbi:MAG: hypothetical protein GY861_09430 [bacterium]|nr:hypothetical protein [bacterium]